MSDRPTRMPALLDPIRPRGLLSVTRQPAVSELPDEWRSIRRRIGWHSPQDSNLESDLLG